MANGGSLDDISLCIGEAALGADGKPTGAFVPGTQVQIPIATTLATGQWGTSDWLIDGKDFNFDPDKLYIFSYGFGTPGGNLTIASGARTAGWGSVSAGDAGADRADPQGEHSRPISTCGSSTSTPTKASRRSSWSRTRVAYNNSGATGTQGELDTCPNQWAEATGGVVAGNIAVPAVFSTVFDDPDQAVDLLRRQGRDPARPGRRASTW